MIARLILALAIAILALPGAAHAREEAAIDVAAGSLAQALPTLSRQAGISISVSDAALWQSRVQPVRGKMSAAKAIKRMLAGTDTRAVRVGARSWRIERKPAARQLARRLPPTPPIPPKAQAPPHIIAAAADEIIVTASKTDLPYSHYAGVATRLGGDDLSFGGERGTESILARMASISSTHLGSGRNKLFIRGIADSSFTGPTQSTVGQYLGDIRLSYNAPDPDLRLYDIDHVEVLEGPQGTLYGAGSLGGIIRMMPKAPDPDAIALQAIAGLSATQHGAPGGDIAAIANLPLGGNGHALRLVGYAITDGGYIDNPLRGQNDVNRVHVRGARATLRLNSGDDWMVDVGGIFQSIASDDAQYADKNAPPLTRSSLVEQGSSAQYGSASLIVTKDWGGLHLQSSHAFIDHRLDERFDASKTGDPPRIFDQNNRTRMMTSETRLSRPFHGGLGWVVGASVIDNRTDQTRALGDANMRAAVTGVTNSITEITAYGEATMEVTSGLVASAGLRMTHARLGGKAEDVAFAIALAGRAVTAHRIEKDLLPSISLMATPLPDLSLYARYQEGFRPGGLAIDGNFVSRFRNDHVATYEAGMRFGTRGASPLSAHIAVSHSKWRDIQADFVDSNGFPTTANIGDGRITSVSGALSVRPVPALSMEVGAVYNHSRVDELSPQFAFVALDRLGRIPNVASHALRGSIDYRAMLGDRDIRINGWANYIGPSRIGIGPVLGEGQGDYVDTGVAMRIGTPGRGLSLTLTNLFDTKGNRFALGTPFAQGSSGFLTPLRPRTLRIGLDMAY